MNAKENKRTVFGCSSDSEDADADAACAGGYVCSYPFVFSCVVYVYVLCEARPLRAK